ncbi:serine O-acetyltransferase [Dechloromonas sp. H13]|uniref:serine O-acetyltransferase n=1 Tax=Dechloromonas sp. H13 TaxID=2570193 RepID=UPI00129108B3|nr:DapH/DapD/GlmU-related protein [Dechloromonas sp. H13]
MNAVQLYRLGNWCHSKHIPLFPTLIRNLIFLLYNSYIPCSASIGDNSIFAYGAIGVVVHANAIIGRGCVIGQGVTIGASEGFVSPETNMCPTIGDNCYIGAGAKILGDIKIGDSCQIGAGAIVLKNIPDHSVVVGVPARVVGQTELSFLAIRS